MAPTKVVLLHPKDNIGVVVDSVGLAVGDSVRNTSITAQEPVPMGHKVALRDISKGQPIKKFNHVIGIATSDILAGQHVHTHNVEMPSKVYVLDEDSENTPVQNYSDIPKSFMGYKRKSGRSGIRNYISVVATVNCSSTVVKAICNHFRNVDLSAKGIDGVIPITHSMGCAQAIGGLNYKTLNNTIAGWAYHPNVVANLFVGLGCEGTTFSSIEESAKELGYKNETPFKKYNVQDVGGTQSAINHGIKEIESLIADLPTFKRQQLPISELGLALNCGGSDAFSSLTANPALGIASDMLVSQNGASVLAEIPECHGAEDLLIKRAKSKDVIQRLEDTFAWWGRYSKEHKVNFNNNLSPGNIAGGITTIIEKSLGAVSKAGSARLEDVVDYSKPIPKSGFSLMNTPGFDPVSVTGLVAGGCNIVCFTTGRGSVYGCSIAPTIKVSTNTKLYERMPDDIDFNAGTIISGGRSIEEVGQELYRFLIEIANGKKTKSEMLHLGWEEFTPWPIGETL